MRGWLATLLRFASGRSTRARQSFAATIGWLLYWLAVPRRKVALRNLELCFPQSDAGQRKQWAQAHFVQFVRAMLDRGVLWFGTADQVRSMVHLTGQEHLQQAMARGAVILVAPHFCGLDAGWSRLTLDHVLATMYQPQRNSQTDALLLAGRQRFVPEGDPAAKQTVIGKQEGVRQVVRALNQGLPLYYLPDMDFGGRDSEFIPFFGVTAATITSVARLAARSKAQVLMCPTLWDEQAQRYVTTIHPADPTLVGGTDEEVTYATASLTHRIEQFIIQTPEALPQYLWTHKRFKSRPDGQPSLY